MKKVFSILMAVVLLVLTATNVFAANLIDSCSGTIYNKLYTTSARLTWDNTYQKVTATTSSNAPSATYVTEVVCTFTYYGVPFGETEYKTGTTSASLTGGGTGYAIAMSTHKVYYGNDSWRTTLGD